MFVTGCSQNNDGLEKNNESAEEKNEPIAESAEQPAVHTLLCGDYIYVEFMNTNLYFKVHPVLKTPHNIFIFFLSSQEGIVIFHPYSMMLLSLMKELILALQFSQPHRLLLRL